MSADDQDLGEGPGPMTFGRFMAITAGAAAVLTLAVIGLWSLVS